MVESYQLNNPVTASQSLMVCKFEDGSLFNRLSSDNHFTVILIVTGKGELEADTFSHPFQPGSLMSFSLYQPYRLNTDVEISGYMIRFHPDFFCLHRHRAEVSCNGVLFNNIYEPPLLSLPPAEGPAILNTFTGMLTEMRRDQVETEVLLSYLKVLLINASRIKLELRNEGYANNQIPEKLAALQSAIETNFRTLHNAAAYAGLLSISQNTLNKACRGHFKKTLSQLISERISLEAKRELYLTLKPVKTIAYELGFADEFHFSRYFKRNIGIAPQYFRDQVGAGKALAA